MTSVGKCFLMAAALVVFSAARAERPPIEKTGEIGKLWVQANPWFPVDMAPVYDHGGPNVPYEHYQGTNSWLRCLQVLHEYGIDGIKPEMHWPSWENGVYRTLLDAAPLVSPDFKVGLFVAVFSKTPEDAIRDAKVALRPFVRDLKENPAVMRIGGRPVIHLYLPTRFAAEGWERVFTALDREIVPMCYLLDYSTVHLNTVAVGGGGVEAFEKKLRELLPVFDGVSSYCYSYEGPSVQRQEAEVLKRLFAEQPGKIFEGGIFNTYTMHFTFGGLETHLTRNWRESIDIWTAANPDAIEITNLFDHYENSLVYPCYEREDFLLRYLQYAMSKWRKSAFRKEKTPELVLCNYTSALIGWTPLDFEVVGFPIDSADRDVSVSVEICATDGKVLETLGPRQMTLDDVRVEKFTVPSTRYLDQRGIVPRLVYTWGGKTQRLNYNPMTLLSPSIRSHRLWWARSTRNQLKVEGDGLWTMDGVAPGGTHLPSGAGQTVFSGNLRAAKGKGPLFGYQRHGVKRDGTELFFTNDGRYQWRGQMALMTPPPGPTLHWYNLEIQNALGHKFQTLPVWETDGSRSGTVTMPIRMEDGSVAEREIEAARVPFYHWKCDHDDGWLLVDSSGLMHNGYIDGTGFGGGHLDYTGYNLCHSGPIGRRTRPTLFRRDADGTGHLHLAGTNYVMVMGGTVLPAASTYEIAVRAERTDRRMGIFGSERGGISLAVLPDGRVRAARRNDVRQAGADAEVVSAEPIAFGTWTRIAVTYDLRKMTLYVNGVLQGSVEARPNFVNLTDVNGVNYFGSHELNNHLLIGADLKPPYAPIDNFVGDIRDIRVYGRNLAPDEFLTRSATRTSALGVPCRKDNDVLQFP